MTPAARLRAMADKATGAPWRDQREPPPVKNVWFDSAPNESTPIESTGTAFALGVAVAACALPHDAALIVHLRNRAHLYADLIEAAAAHIQTRDEWAKKIDGMSEDECRQQLEQLMRQMEAESEREKAVEDRLRSALAAIDAADKEPT